MSRENFDLDIICQYTRIQDPGRCVFSQCAQVRQANDSMASDVDLRHLVSITGGGDDREITSSINFRYVILYQKLIPDGNVSVFGYVDTARSRHGAIAQIRC